MSSPAAYVVNFNGKFKTHENGLVEYVDGLSQNVECDASELWVVLEREIPVSLFRQRIWYKLPYEGVDELKLLWNDSGNFQRLCQIALWVSLIEIYMEDDGSVQSRTVDQDPLEAQAEENEQAINVDPGQNQETDNTGATSKQQTHFEEEDRVEAIIAEINDDSDTESLPKTPICSENEEDDQYEKYVRGSGELKMLQVFTSGEEFKEGVLEYALKGGWNVKYARWGPIKCEAICATKCKERCLWRIYCSYEKAIDKLLVKTFNDNHTCLKDGRCKLLTDNVIARMFVNELRINPKMQPKDLQGKIEEKYNLVCTHDQLRKAKKKGLQIIQAEYDEQYTKIKDYANEIRSSNPGSTVELATVMIDGPLEVFEKFYVCYESLRTSWIQCSRPIIGIDGCFLKNGTKAQLLSVVGRDANNSIYPIAWAVVQVENQPNWCWFIKNLQQDLMLGNGSGFTLISDKQKGLLLAVEEWLPAVEHRTCARHVYCNICRVHPRRGRFKRLFWNIVQSYTMADYEAALQRLQEYDNDVYEALMQRNPRFFSRAYFQTGSTCEDALNNHSESYNHTVEKARPMPLVEMLETVRRQAMVRNEMRRVKSMNHKAKFCPRVAKLIKHEEEFRKYCKIFPGPTGLFEVIETGTSFKVNMNARTCTCRRWDLTGVPCRHSLRVIMDKKLNVEDFVASVFLTRVWQRQYSYNIIPLVGMKFWVSTGQPTLQAPVREVKKGRTKNIEKRIKSVSESPKKGKKASSHGRVQHCQRCGVPGHYQRKCKAFGAFRDPALSRKKKKTTDNEEESLTLAEGEGPSQATQD